MARTSAGADSHGLPRFALNGSYTEAVSNSGSRPTAAGDRYICLAKQWPLAMLKQWYGKGASQQKFGGKVGCVGNGPQQCRQKSLNDEPLIDQRLASFWLAYPVHFFLRSRGLSAGRLLLMSCPEYPAAVGLHVTVYNTLGDKDWVTEAIYSLTHYIGGVIAQLEAEHAQGAARIAALRDALELYRRTGAAGLAGFDAALKVYTEQEWRHMNTEEREVFPLAQKHLNAEDWAAIDAAFLANGNPWEGAAGEYAALFTKIVNIAPAPVGLGG